MPNREANYSSRPVDLLVDPETVLSTSGLSCAGCGRRRYKSFPIVEPAETVFAPLKCLTPTNLDML